MITISVIISNLKSLAEWILIALAFVYFVYGCFHASLYDDAKKAINNKHISFRSIHANFSQKFSFGLPIPILSKPENEEIKKYKRDYNRIIFKFWLIVVLAIIANQI